MGTSVAAYCLFCMSECVKTGYRMRVIMQYITS